MKYIIYIYIYIICCTNFVCQPNTLVSVIARSLFATPSAQQTKQLENKSLVLLLSPCCNHRNSAGNWIRTIRSFKSCHASRCKAFDCNHKRRAHIANALAGAGTDQKHILQRILQAQMVDLMSSMQQADAPFREDGVSVDDGLYFRVLIYAYG